MKLQNKCTGLIVEVSQGTSYDECVYRELIEPKKIAEVKENKTKKSKKK